MRMLWQDIRYSSHMLRRSPGFTAVVILTLAVAIGATTAIYSVVHATILNPVPVEDPDRLYYVETYGSYVPEQEKVGLLVNPVTVAELRAHSELFAELAIHFDVDLKYRGRDFTERVPGCRVSANFLSMWGTQPALGRLFSGPDGKSDAEPTIILSHRFWSQKLGADSNIVGKLVEFGDGTDESPLRQYRVVGIMPPHFRYPHASTAYWIATDDPSIRSLAEDPDGRAYRDRDYGVKLRLAEDVEVRRVQALLDVIQARQIQDDPRANAGWVLRLGKLTELLVDEKVHRSLWTLLAVVGLVWLIACANVASLLTARAEGRCHELAVRSALGAERWHLMRLLLVESLLLAFLGGLCGLFTTAWGMDVLDTFLGGTRLRPFELSWGVFGISLVVALLTGLAFGLVPAWYASRSRANEMLKQSSAVTTQGISGRWLMRGLVVSEVALAFILLSGAGLMIQSVVRLLSVDVGYRPQGLVQIDVGVPHQKYFDEHGARKMELATRLHEAFLALPGVESSGVMVTTSGWRPYYVDDPQRSVDVVASGCGLGSLNPFVTMGAPLLRGRFLNETDREQNTVVVNETLARTFWPDDIALGKTFRNVQRDPARAQIWQVVGVVGNIKNRSFDERVKPTFYRPDQDYYQRFGTPSFFVRCAGNTLSLVRPLRATIRDIEPEMEHIGLIQVAQRLYETTESRRRYTLYLSLLAGVGVALAAMGIYAILAHAAARRMREMGIRLALGATSGAVTALVIRDGARLAMVGVTIGIAGALAGTRLIQNQLFEIKSHDPITLSVAVAGLLLIAVGASAIPARRAGRVDPMMALRQE